MEPKKIDLIFGTRPEAIKMIPLILALKNQGDIFKTRTILTAQHREMLDQVMNLFGVNAEIDLNIMQSAQSLTDITTRGLESLEHVFKEDKPDLVLVHGDTTTTLTATLAAFYQKIAVGHVESGLRSFDLHNPYPEEMNRKLCDAICNLHFAPTASSKNNLLNEGISDDNIFITGNTGIDGLKLALKNIDSSEESYVSNEVKTLINKPYILLTIHRRENIGLPLNNFCSAVSKIAIERPDINFIYPVHLNPAIRNTVYQLLGNISNIHLLEPQDYSNFVILLKNCKFVVTDSGGVQEEAPSLGKPVLVLRKVTERPEAVTAGTVKIIGTEVETIKQFVDKLLDDSLFFEGMANATNPYGDGLASERTVNAIKYYFSFISERPVNFNPE